MLRYILYSLAARILGGAPKWLAYFVAARIADLHFVLAVRSRAAVRKNLLKILSSTDASGDPVRLRRRVRYLTRRTFENFAKHIVDFLRMEKLAEEMNLRLVSVEGMENLDRALSRGRGVISVTGHLGNWEWGGGVMGLLGFPITSLYLSQGNPRLDRFFTRLREMYGGSVHPLGFGVRNLFRALGEGRVVAMLADRDFRETGLEVEFFGSPALFPRGPAELSLRTGAPILPAFLVQCKDESYRLIFEPEIIPEGSARNEEDVRRTMGRIARVLESYVRRYPSQWFIFFDFWKRGGHV